MKINDYNYLDKAVEYNGAKSLYPNLFPLRKDIFYTIELSEETLSKGESDLIIPEVANTSEFRESTLVKKFKGAIFTIIATGRECDSLEPGDKVLATEQLIMTAMTPITMVDGAVFFLNKELYVRAVYGKDSE